ncbi:MAG: sulfatase [Candidatus Latescibacteria bacterium]|jgi:arylsulfatase A-like enzyme|nr:sulfatase [Candidatus Latescibacterota bacterium]
MNVLVIMNDALRPGHMGCYGYDKNTTPNCDRLAAEGVSFTSCIAVSAHTFPPVVSICTGQDTATHGLMTSEDYARWMRDGMGRTPLHLLAENGMRVDGELVMRWAPLGFERDCNDFDAYVEAHREGAWFYFAEPYPTHLPYDPPNEYYEAFLDADFQPDEDTRERLEIVRTRMILHPPDVQSAMEAGEEDAIGEGDDAHKRSTATVEFEPGDAPGVSALYDGEVRVFDDLVGRWIAKLEAMGLLDETLVIVVSDHGEELLERGHVGHTSCNLKGTLYDECIRVPLIMRAPGRLPAGRVILDQVSQVDIMPTVFDLLGLDLSLAVDGSSLLPLIRGETDTFRAEAYAETPPAGWQALPGDERRIYCVRTREWKLILHEESPGGARCLELYNLTEDPSERCNRIHTDSGVAADLSAKLAAYVARCR